MTDADKQTSDHAPESPPEIWLAYDWHGPWWDLGTQTDIMPANAVRYIRADLVGAVRNAE